MKHTIKRRTRKLEASVIGFDSETLQGPPITFQFYSEHAPQINAVVFIGKRQAIDVFLSQCGKLPPGNYRMYGHNLEFDMLSALWEKRAEIRDGNIDLKVGLWTISGRYSKPIFAVLEDGERYIELVDSFLWFMTSLDGAAKLVCPHLPKLIRPAGLGVTNYTPKDTGFVAYAMRDAEVAFFLGVAVEKFHTELEIPPQISLASMAAAVFRLRYMRANIYQPPLYEWMVGAAAAYHGGVNRVRPNAAPAWHINVSALDISSAYPDAMNIFPSFEDPNGYRKYKHNRGTRKTARVPDFGCYKVGGNAAACDWPALFDHNFKPIKGRFSDTWVTGFELNAAIDADECKLSDITGYTYESDKASRYSPFATYVQDFYRLKAEAKDPVMRYMYKILLNALTGKFIQTSPDYTLVDGQLVKINRAGGLYHPFIAGLITGHTRAHIHALEHEYEALHTATDGIFVPGKHKGAAKKSLGAVVSEGFGDLALFRNKLYIFYANDKPADFNGYESQVFDGRYILKCARHGFQGSVGALEQMLLLPPDARKYKVNKPIKLKTALKTDDTPNKFITSERALRNIEEFKVYRYG
jgi:DNA polymerase type B, organellar and viral.